MTISMHLCRYINQQFTVPIPVIRPHHRLQKDLDLNDIEVIEVVVFMELLYGLTLPDETLTPSLSVGQLSSLIEHYSDKQQSKSAFQVYRNPQYLFAESVKSAN